MTGILARSKKRLRRVLEQSNAGYRYLLKRDHGLSGQVGRPDAPWANAVLQTQAEADRARAMVHHLGLPLIQDPPKNWDSLAALQVVLDSTGPDARVFDAGGELYSMILPWLSLYGYTHLIAGNLVFEKARRRGPITYKHADITRTDFPTERFDAVTSMSVIEHGVDLEAYFREMARILKPGGHLITSTDYFDEPTDTRGQSAFGQPIQVFDREGIRAALETARGFGLELTGPLDLEAEDRVVTWEKYGLSYSFIVFTLRKAGAAASEPGL